MPMNRMDTKCWFSLAKVLYGIRKYKNSDFAILILNEKWNFTLISRHYNIHDIKAKSLVPEKGVYLESEAYTGQPINERTKKIVMEYYINDAFNSSRHVKNLHI